MIPNYNRRWQQGGRRFGQEHLINDRIGAAELRVLDSMGTQLGVMSRQEALNKGREDGLDLVLIAPQAVPPVAKLIEYSKFLYQESKRLKEAKKGSKKSGIKNIKLSLFIGSGDSERLKKRATEFIIEGHQVRISLLLKGREVGKKSMAFDVINNFINSIAEAGISSPPKVQGRIVLAVISKRKVHEKQNQNQKISPKEVSNN